MAHVFVLSEVFLSHAIELKINRPVAAAVVSTSSEMRTRIVHHFVSPLLSSCMHSILWLQAPETVLGLCQKGEVLHGDARPV